MTTLYTEAEAQTRETFLALMWALSYPGRLYKLPSSGSSLALIGEALLDLETSYYAPNINLKAMLAHTGAAFQSTAQAAYHFYTACTESTLGEIVQAASGSMQFPDQAATLIIGCTFGAERRMTWCGPGIKDQAVVSLSNVPDAFWSLRESVCRFPLGWDVYFVDGPQVIGLPRTTHVEWAS